MEWLTDLEFEDTGKITHILSNENFIFALGDAELFKLKLSDLEGLDSQNSIEGSIISLCSSYSYTRLSWI